MKVGERSEGKEEVSKLEADRQWGRGIGVGEGGGLLRKGA